MKRHWRNSAWALLITLASWQLACVQAQDKQSSPENPPTVTKSSAMEQRVDDVAKELANLQKQNDQMSQLLKKLNDQVERLNTDLSLQLQATTSEVKMLKNRLEQIEKDLARLQTEQQNQRRAFSINPPGNSLNVPMGQIQLINEYPMTMYVFVDGISYTLPPYSNRTLTRAAGVFNYEVYGVQANVLRTLAAGENFTIRIR